MPVFSLEEDLLVDIFGCHRVFTFGFHVKHDVELLLAASVGWIDIFILVIIRGGICLGLWAAQYRGVSLVGSAGAHFLFSIRQMVSMPFFSARAWERLLQLRSG